MTARQGAEGRFYDALERRTPEEREEALFAALRQQVAHAIAAAPGYAETLSGVEPSALTGREALSALPLVRKASLVERQRQEPPFGGLNAVPPGEAGRVFQSPGPIFELEGRRSGHARMARAFFAAGFRPGELIHNSFAYHLTPGGWIMDAGARALGCAVVPAGTGNSEQQVEAIAQLRPAGFSGTPDFLKVLLDKAEAMGRDLSSVTKALVSGGALFPSLRAEYEGRGISVAQCYATAELGLIAYESEARDGLILDEGVLVEIVRPGTGDPLPEGEVGEVVVTTFDPGYPLIRFATGDLSAFMSGESPCGRTNRRIKGWMGRADQTTKVKGLFVRPEQVAAALKPHREVLRARLVVERLGESDRMTLRCEVSQSYEHLAERLAESLRAATTLKGEVELLPPGSLPNDGKIIDDLRSYD